MPKIYIVIGRMPHNLEKKHALVTEDERCAKSLAQSIELAGYHTETFINENSTIAEAFKVMGRLH